MNTNISWPDLVFLAEAEREDFSDIQIVTLYSHCVELAEEVLQKQGCWKPNVLENQKYLQSVLPQIECQEFVRVLNDRVVVGVDVDTIDDNAVTRALSLLVQVEKFEVGRTYEFPPYRRYQLKLLH